VARFELGDRLFEFEEFQVHSDRATKGQPPYREPAGADK
jgi:hypothetical protein